MKSSKFIRFCVFWATIATTPYFWADAFVFSFSSKNRYARAYPQRGSFSLHQTVESSTKSGVAIDSVVQAVNELFPQDGLEQRIALSRKDGYWPFIKAGEDPPQELVYGEFDILLLQESLKRARELLGKDDKDIIFCDLGSGTGRLVLATAALHPTWKLCRGIELLQSIHEEAVEKIQSCRINNSYNNDSQKFDDEKDESNVEAMESVGIDYDPKNTTAIEFSLASNVGPLPLAPIELECGSFMDPYSSFCDANIFFCFSSAMPKHIIIDLARSIGRQSLPGTIIITTEYQLPLGGILDPLPDDPEYPYGRYELELVDTLSGDCTAVGGESDVFIHRVVKSFGTGERRVQPPIPESEIAYRAIQFMEERDPNIFLRQVSNQMAYLGFPESWRPNI